MMMTFDDLSKIGSRIIYEEAISRNRAISTFAKRSDMEFSEIARYRDLRNRPLSTFVKSREFKIGHSMVRHSPLLP